ncbi:MAG: hypothetical protein IPJ34_04720 [Myxococcales bacterium]|nr:hypothetical protein [Myxococcales bacterium]
MAEAADLRSVLAALDALLIEERRAIRKLDGLAVDHAAVRKLTLVRLVQGFSQPELRAEGATLTRVIAALRQNGVLLAHARDCLRDAIAARSERPLSTDSHDRPVTRPGVRLRAAL